MITIPLHLAPRFALLAAAPVALAILSACSTGSKDATTADSSAAITTDSQPAASSMQSAGSATPATDSAAAPAASTAAAGAMVDPNGASREALSAIPGMTAAATDALIAGRPYQTMVDVDKVLAKSLGAPERKNAYAKLWKPIAINSAKGDEILLIPGVGAKMRHEFEEYRPYRSIEQFRREIGKYVNKEELARLEQYVAIP